VAPKTSWGRLLTIVYALVGIPLTFLYLSNIGNFLADCFRLFYKRVCCDVLCCEQCERERKKQRLKQRRRKEILHAAAAQQRNFRLGAESDFVEQRPPQPPPLPEFVHFRADDGPALPVPRRQSSSSWTTVSSSTLAAGSTEGGSGVGPLGAGTAVGGGHGAQSAVGVPLGAVDARETDILDDGATDDELTTTDDEDRHATVRETAIIDDDDDDDAEGIPKIFPLQKCRIIRDCC